MIDPEPVEIPDDAEPTHVAVAEAEPTHVAVAEPVEVVEVIVTVEVDERDDEDDDLAYMPGYLLFAGKSLEEIQHNLSLLARKLNPALDAYLEQVEALIEAAVKTLRLEISQPDQFDR